jgi:hypothetical protein
VLKNQCGVSEAWHPQSGTPAPTTHEFDAIWDTGATGSVITQNVIDACGLAPTGMVEVHGVHDSQLCETFLVNIRLPNSVAFANLRVTKGNLKDADVLIGMDIINRGDFAVTNVGGITKFSFRVPSITHLDFVEEHKRQVAAEDQAKRVAHGGTRRTSNRPKPQRQPRKK